MRHPTRRQALAVRWSLVFACIVITGCGGGGSGGSTSGDPAQPSQPANPQPTVAQQLQALQAAGRLPDLDRSTTVMGFDANNDGVRDDIAIYVGAPPDTAGQKKSLLQMAQSVQLTMTVNVSNAEALRLAAGELNAAVHCIWQRYEPAQARNKVLDMRKLMVNTRTRFQAYARYNEARSGASVTLPLVDTCK